MSSAPAATYSWKSIRKLALRHKKRLFYAHLVALLGTVASVPVPLLMPLLVDEVLLDKPGPVLGFINHFSPTDWHLPIVYIAAVLLASLLLRIVSIIFNTLQLRQFSVLSKEVVFTIRKSLIGHLQTISMSEYESLGTGTVVTHLVTDLDTLDNFIGSTPLRQNSCRLKFLKKIKFEIRDENVYKVF